MTRQLKTLLVVSALLLACGLAAAQCSPCTVFAPTVTPANLDSGDTNATEVGMKFRADTIGYVTGVRFYKATTNGGTHIGNLWTSSGTLLATATFSNETASGWQQVNFSAPVQITTGVTYVVSYYAPQGHYSFDPAFFLSSGVDNPPLHALQDGTDGNNGLYNYFSDTFPTQSFGQANYWIDVVYYNQGSTTAPSVIATNPANAASGVAPVSPLSVNFSEPMNPASINSTSFQLFGPGNAQVPGTVFYSSTGAAGATFQPSASLAFQTAYTAVVRGTVQDFLGNSMGGDFSWTFTTGNGPSNLVCPCTIFSSTAVPSLADAGDATAGEFGVKFKADVNGFVTGIRFYKSAANTGTHTGNLWTAAGALLGTVTFTGESGSGWQQANFTSPIPVTGGATYVASYFTSAGHYSWDEYQLTVGIDNVPLHALSSSSSGGNGVYTASASSTFPVTTYNASSYGVDVVYMLQTSTTPPSIVSVTPANGAVGVSLAGTISVQFNEPMDPTTINNNAFQLVDASNNVIPGIVSYVPATASLTFRPTLSLLPQASYTATVFSSVRDAFGNALSGSTSWSFTTAPPPGDSGPGGPILVIASSVNPFSRYMSEILLNEGLNEFRVKDITTLTSTVLSQYDIAILGDFPLTSAQASMLNTWVTTGGSLIAMHPDSQLNGLLGLTPTGGTLAEGYMQVNTSTAPGTGIYGQTMQYHGSANLYSLSGATSVATLYSNATTPTASPAVTLANAGAGQAAAFTYDLSRSVVYLRQGNPAWSGQERDNIVDPAYNVTEIRSNDLYFGNAYFDPEPDWINLNKVQIPQADEQQRLLTNLIQMMNARRKPLPRFWYLPNGYKAAVIMTGDDHGGNGTQPRFDTYVAESPANCSVADWTCVRATSYVFPVNVSFTNNNYPSYIAQGFEIANHADNAPTCSTFTPASLEASITAELGLMTQFFPLAPPSATNRTHCVLWSDYDSEPAILLNHGVRLDTSYYYWPDEWVLDRPGLFTGSGLPMRYSDRNGNAIDVYQAPTQFPDETTWNMPADINTVLANATGSLGFYAVLTANMHTDHIQETQSDQIVAAAQSYGAPVVAAVQMLNWLDGRNNSTFSNMSWASPVLSFTVTAATGSHGLEVMVPASSIAGPLVVVLVNGVVQPYSLQTVKGLQYGAFLSTGGNYQAIYGQSYSVSGTISGAGGNGATVTIAAGTATATTTASASGAYTFTGVPNGSTYTVTPSKAGFTFTPASQSVAVNGANVNGVNFTTVVTTYSLSGTISGAGGNGATVTLSGAGTGTTTASSTGVYSFPALANGAYTVTPSKAGFTFSPASQVATVNGANLANVNFSSAAATFSISGTISGTGGNGATVALSGAGTGTTTASSTGTYSFTGLANGAYTVTPSKSGFLYTPTSLAATVNNANVANVNFGSAASLTTVNLSSYYNIYAIATSGNAPKSGGLDGSGYSYNSATLGTTATYQGITFTLGPANAPDGVSSITIPVSAAGYSQIFLLGSASFGAQSNQSIIVTYTDNTTSTFTQNISDWWAPQNFTGETNVTAASNVILPSGAVGANPVELFGYTLNLTAGKTAASVKLPTNRNVVFLAMGLGRPTPTAATPTFSPAPGSFSPSVSVTLSDATPGAVIHYTTNNTTPTATSTTYSGAIPVTATTTIQAIAVANGYNNSAVASGTYTIATYSLSGTISGAGGNGATVTLSGAQAATTTASSTGTYTFTGLPNGAYTVTPSKSGYSFSPASLPATVNNANVSAVNFSSSAVTYTISGTISGAGGNGATVTLSGAGTGTTTASSTGTYSFTVPNGAYTVTPSKAGYAFSPTSLAATVNGANVGGVNFSSAATYSISGTISGLGGNAATVTLSGAGTGTTTASSTGTFTFSGLTNGAYTVTPSKSGFTYTPASLGATVNGANVTGVNFATVTYTISGTISGAGGNAATVTLSGAASATTTSSSSGTYSFSGLVNGAYTVSPAKTGFSFSPSSQSATVNGANLTVNFSSAAASYSISGTISGSGGNGATVILSGTSSATTTANSSGSYSFSGLANGSYAVVPVMAGYNYSPSSQLKTVNGASITGVNFSSTALAGSVVSLSSSYNVYGIATVGTRPISGGFDNGSFAFNSSLLGSSLSYQNLTFSLGSANSLDAVDNKTITLPAAQYGKLFVLGAGVNGNQTNQSFVVTYSDGTTTTFTQSMSDWATPQNYSGESTVKATASRIGSSGQVTTPAVNVYGYTFTLNSAKTLASVKLPANRNAVFFGIGVGSPTPSAITPYIQVNGAAWQSVTTATVSSGSTVNLGPQPLTGTWSWIGPSGFTSSSREIDRIPLSTGPNVFVTTYTSPNGAQSVQPFVITVSGS